MSRITLKPDDEWEIPAEPAIWQWIDEMYNKDTIDRIIEERLKGPQYVLVPCGNQMGKATAIKKWREACQSKSAAASSRSSKRLKRTLRNAKRRRRTSASTSG